MAEDRRRAIGDASLNSALLEPYLTGVLTDATIAELPNHSAGKVRESYDLADGSRIMIASDRLSAFDRILTAVPLKGQVLTQLARFWFDATKDIAPNHVLEYPDPNVVVGRRLKILPVEIVVRDYLAGTTSTSILSMYRAGHRHMYGIAFSDGLEPNQRLPSTILTPTTKAAAGAHDEPLSATQIVADGLLTAEQWERTEAMALALFRRGRELAAARGLILVDTKYEFGFDGAGQLLVADEIHTPDSSRYWQLDSYQSRFDAGEPPESFDKDFVRSWVVARCDPYRDAIPAIPDEVRIQAGKLYIDAYERITGATLTLPDAAEPVLDRIRRNLARFF